MRQVKDIFFFFFLIHLVQVKCVHFHMLYIFLVTLCKSYLQGTIWWMRERTRAKKKQAKHFNLKILNVVSGNIVTHKVCHELSLARGLWTNNRSRVNRANTYIHTHTYYFHPLQTLRPQSSRTCKQTYSLSVASSSIVPSNVS